MPHMVWEVNVQAYMAVPWSVWVLNPGGVHVVHDRETGHPLLMGWTC